jgi:secreted PhoX family phosphatase
MVLAGPAAGHPLLQTAADPTGTQALGTLNNCANGATPWAAYLTCEENFNGYFENWGPGEVTEAQQALFDSYGITEEGFGYRWAATDERFRADLHPNEPNRHGWVVEVNPWVPGSVPVKRTALGRIKHEGAAHTVNSEGRVVVYMGDDERFEYVYKFVSAGPWRELLDAGTSPLDEGTLYVARFDEDGRGAWLPLVWGEGPLTAANGFADQGEVLVRTRDAADAVGATPMDRPEWAAVAPWKDVFMTFTNNTRREEPDAANPRADNADGHILRWAEDGRDAAATSFSWDVFLLAGAGEGSGDGSTVPADAAFGSPDGLWVDGDGRVWIQTDGSQPISCNNQMLVADPWTSEVKRFLVGPAGCEVTGVTATPDQTTLFVNIQHPGEDAEPGRPTAQSSWPDGDPSGRPRSATLADRKLDGGGVGT